MKFSTKKQKTKKLTFLMVQDYFNPNITFIGGKTVTGSLGKKKHFEKTRNTFLSCPKDHSTKRLGF